MALLMALVISLAFTAAVRTWGAKGSRRRSQGGPTSTQSFEWPEDPAESASFQDLWQRVSKGQPAQEPPPRWSLELLKKLEWRRFEEVCAAYFRILGFRAELNTFGPDEGIDIQLFPAGQTQPAVLVQCKAWTSEPVGVSTVRELYGVMARKKIPEGIFVTTSTFTPDAKAFPEGNELHLWDGNEFLEKILSLTDDQRQGLLKVATEGDFTTPTCASCGIKMVWRSPKTGANSFWGCENFPKCRNVMYQAT